MGEVSDSLDIWLISSEMDLAVKQGPPNDELDSVPQYNDPGCSGSKCSRPSLCQALQRVASGQHTAEDQCKDGWLCHAMVRRHQRHAMPRIIMLQHSGPCTRKKRSYI